MRPFDSADAKRIIEQYRKLLTEMSSAEEYRVGLRTAITEASDALLTQEALQILKDVPVEELNRDKRGFRIKALREKGYRSVADIMEASVYSLAAINGISDEAAYSIKQAAGQIAATTRQGVKIRLSEDNKSEAASQLILAVSKFKNSEKHIAEIGRLNAAYKSKIDYAIEDLRAATGGLKWLFSSKVKKQKAAAAYEVLNELLQGTYFSDARENLAALDKIKSATASEAWLDFSENSIRFFNILEDINPGILGADDAICGLPEELAQEIRDQDILSEGLHCELRRYQEWGVKYVLHQERVLLGDEMGLGKTIQAIAAMVSLKNTGATHFIVVCPASVLANWCREIMKMSDLKVVKVHGQDRSAALDLWIKDGGVAVTTYETTGHFKLDKDFKYSLLVVDEAHYIKNPDAHRTINVKKISDHAERLLFMTGTALENKVDEMISLIKILQPDIAASVRGMEFLSSAPQFRSRVASVYYRRKREDVLTELPDLIENREWCSLTREEESAYEEAVLNRRYADARRVSWNIGDLRDSSKAARMMEIIDETKEDGRKIIVFSFFLDTIKKITDMLCDSCYGPINGSVTPQKRQEIIDEFDKAPAGSVLAAQIQAGGTGLNIQSASVVILCEPQFKPSIENQAISRAYRMGQTRNVLVYRLLCEDTVDEKIISLLESKQLIFDAFADESVAASTSMELDDNTFGNIIKEEVDRINAKRENMKVEKDELS